MTDTIKVENIITLLRGADALERIIHEVRLQLTDDAVIQYLLDCRDALDDEEEKRILRAAADVLTDNWPTGMRA